MKALCVGHSTYDTTLPVDFYPEENLKYRIKRQIVCGGGPASNGAYLLAKWGFDTTIVSVVGDDFYGDKVIDDFEKIGANTEYLLKYPGYHTSSSYIIANMSNGSRTILTSRIAPVRKIDKEITVTDADVILIDGEHPESAMDALQKNPNAISVLDAGRLTDDTRALGKMVTYLICSHDFAEEFSGMKTDVRDFNTLVAIYEKLREYFQTNVIITLEANGSFTMINGVYRIIPSVSVKAVDSTGAGDIFHGAFTYFIGMGYPLEEAIRCSSITSAISVTRIGSRFSIPNLSEVLEYNDVI